MSLDARQKKFAEAAERHFGATRHTKLSRLFGVSNSAKVISGGIQLGVVNMEAARDGTDAFILACVLKFPPEDEVYFAVLVRSDRERMLERLADMKRLGAAAPPREKKAVGSDPAPPIGEEDAEADGETEASPSIRYSHRNNLTVVCLADNGRLWLRNAGFWNDLQLDFTAIGPGVTPDEIIFSIYPPAASARSSLLARQFTGWLGSLAGREKLHEIRVWADSASVSPAMQRLPVSIPVADIEADIRAAGGHYPHGEVRRFHAALNFLEHKHFVILSGLSGTGKTRLALQYARAVHGLTDDARNPLLVVCPVRPEWTDPSGLTGYHDVLSGRYVVPPFLEAVLIATAHRASPVFVVLDEMNLARVEHYFSDVLSAIETGQPLQLHPGGVPLEGSTGTAVPAALPLPPNLFITGTINVDETTNPVSDKVLDRAVVIDMSQVDLAGFLKDLSGRHPELAASAEAAGPRLIGVQKLLTGNGQGFGYRVAEEVVRYQAFAATHGTAGADDAFDELMAGKVLVKLRGMERQRPLLAGLSKVLAGLPASLHLLDRLTADLDEFGSFQAAR